MRSARKLGTLGRVADALREAVSRDAESSVVTAEISRLRAKPTSRIEPNDLLVLSYFSMLGYKVDFAHPAVVSAMGSSNQNWKAAGYFGASVMMTCPSAATRVEAVLRSDLASTEVAFVLASLQYLSMVPNTAVAFWAEVSSIANPSSNFPPHVRKRAYACMLVCVRDDPSLLPPSQWAPRLAHCFTAEHDVGALLAVCSLLNGAIQASSKGWEGVIPPVINVLLLFSESRVAKSATYRGVLCPWLHAKLLRLLRLFPRNLSRR
ncbi:MAG: uncharacterized protein KVP18_002626 [Porospora cf. gigantea A]|uniref:uncharacterized protein n=1 Tax=Porospora cf. gigantea A TaxID=2853593 RepID=UPI0035599F4A|nr:MAG: hypothetical protein KVP18_002626 [Porospora cf. gigantea A]